MTNYQKAREAADEKLREDMRVIERKMLFGVERTLTVKVVPDPHCKSCRGEGSKMSGGQEVTCYCITWGEIVPTLKEGETNGKKDETETDH